MNITGMRMIYYIAGCFSSAPPLDRQDEPDSEQAPCTTMAECMDRLGIQPMTESIKDSVAKLNEYTNDARRNFFDLLNEDLPYHLDIKTALEFIVNPFPHTVLAENTEPTKLESNLFVKSFEKIIRQTDVMQSSIDTVMGDITDRMPTLIGSICDVILNYPGLNITGPNNLFVNSLQEFIANRNRNYEALYAKVERDLNLLDHALYDCGNQIADPKYCLTLRFLLQIFLNSFCECGEYHKQMEEYKVKLHNFLQALEHEFEALMTASEGWLTEAVVRDACYNCEICKMIVDMNYMIIGNQSRLMGILASLRYIAP